MVRVVEATGRPRHRLSTRTMRRSEKKRLTGNTSTTSKPASRTSASISARERRLRAPRLVPPSRDRRSRGHVLERVPIVVVHHRVAADHPTELPEHRHPLIVVEVMHEPDADRAPERASSGYGRLVASVWTSPTRPSAPTSRARAIIASDASAPTTRHPRAATMGRKRPVPTGTSRDEALRTEGVEGPTERRLLETLEATTPLAAEPPAVVVGRDLLAAVLLASALALLRGHGAQPTRPAPVTQSPGRVGPGQPGPVGWASAHHDPGARWAGRRPRSRFTRRRPPASRRRAGRGDAADLGGSPRA